MAITATPGKSADSYISLTGAKDYFAARPHSEDWDGLKDDGAKESVLVMATRLLDDLRWVGVKATDSALRWPRSYVSDRDDQQLADNTIPVFLERATAELAMHLSATDSTRETEMKEFSKLSAGPIKIDFNIESRDNPVIPKNVMRIIGHYLKSSQLTLVRS